MDLVTAIALFFHMVGFASLFGVAAVQVRAQERIARNGMMHGALAQLVSGAVLAEIDKAQIDPWALHVKGALLLIIIGILVYYRRDPRRVIPATPFFVVFGLTVVEVIIAVTWVQVGLR